MTIKKRVQLSAARKAFLAEIRRLERFDELNHVKFGAGEINKLQIELLVESIFFAAYRSFESFLREVFILYCLEKQGSKRPKVKSFLRPRNFLHAEQMIKSSMDFLDWTRTDDLITRAEMYLDNDGHPIKLVITANRQSLRDFKKIRNHIAHNSLESEAQFFKVVRTYNNGIIPVSFPTPGEYLMWPSRTNPACYLLTEFLGLMKTLGVDLT